MEEQNGIPVEEKSPEEIIEYVKNLQNIYQESLSSKVGLMEQVRQLSNTIDIQNKKKLTEPIVLESMLKDEAGDYQEIKLTCSYLHPSSRIRNLLNVCEEEYSAELAKLESEYNKIENFKEIKNKDYSTLNPDENLIITKYNNGKKALLTNFTLNYIKTILDDRQLTTDNKALVRSEIDSEFWQNVALGEVEKCILSFRLAHQI